VHSAGQAQLRFGNPGDIRIVGFHRRATSKPADRSRNEIPSGELYGSMSLMSRGRLSSDSGANNAAATTATIITAQPMAHSNSKLPGWLSAERENSTTVAT